MFIMYFHASIIYMKNIFLFCLYFFTLSFAVAQNKPKGLMVNSKAPEFKAKAQNGEDISLEALRKSGSVVVVFYRGNWCPYCSAELQKLQDSLQYIVSKGAQVVAITPEASEGIDETIKKTKAAFPIIYDEDVKIAKEYDVSYQVDEATINTYKKNWGVDFFKINHQKDKAYLPVPAIYIVDKNGFITYRFFDTDITKRPSVKELLSNL